MENEAVQDPILSALDDTATDNSQTIDETETENNTEPAEVEETESETTEPETEAEANAEAEESVELDPKDEARRRYDERQAFKKEQEKNIQIQNQDYIDEAENDLALQVRNLEVKEYQRVVENTQEKIMNDYERVIADPSLQIFNPKSTEFNEKAYDYALRNYNDKIEYHNGNTVGFKETLFNHFKETAELLQGAVKSGAIQQVRAGRQMKATADIRPAASPKETTKDPILDILKSE